MIMRNFITRSLLALIAVLATGIPAAFAEGMPAGEPSFYMRLGGLAPISVVVSDFIDALVPDKVLNANPAIAEARKRVPPPYLKFQVTALVCQATGGPCQYQGRSMKESHAHLNITQKEWERMEMIFKRILAKHRVPAKESGELLAIVESTKGDIVVASGNK